MLALVGLACLLLAFSFNLSLELFHDDDAEEVIRWDNAALSFVASFRRPVLNQVFIDITALGSTAIVTLIALIFFVVFTLLRDRWSVLQLLTAAAGAGILSKLFKLYWERPRPTIVPRLVDAAGYSFPSGHSLGAAALYMTFLLMVLKYFHRPREWVALTLLTLLVIGLVAFSRVYLGVHYPSDVFSGTCLGMAWALLVAGAIGAWKSRASW